MLPGEEYLRQLCDCRIVTKALPDGRVKVAAAGHLETFAIAEREQTAVYSALGIFLSLHMMAALLRYHGIAPLTIQGCALPGRISLVYPALTMAGEHPVYAGYAPAASGPLVKYYFHASLVAAPGPRAAQQQSLSDYLRALEKEKEHHP
jgi:hypothetical protein